MPWRDAAAVHMAKDGIDEPTLYLPILWYAHDELTAEIRLAYMDAVTLLEREFSPISSAIGAVRTVCNTLGI